MIFDIGSGGVLLAPSFLQLSLAGLVIKFATTKPESKESPEI